MGGAVGVIEQATIIALKSMIREWASNLEVADNLGDVLEVTEEMCGKRHWGISNKEAWERLIGGCWPRCHKCGAILHAIMDGCGWYCPDCGEGRFT